MNNFPCPVCATPLTDDTCPNCGAVVLVNPSRKEAQLFADLSNLPTKNAAITFLKLHSEGWYFLGSFRPMTALFTLDITSLLEEHANTCKQCSNYTIDGISTKDNETHEIGHCKKLDCLVRADAICACFEAGVR